MAKHESSGIELKSVVTEEPSKQQHTAKGSRGHHNNVGGKRAPPIPSIPELSDEDTTNGAGNGGMQTLSVPDLQRKTSVTSTNTTKSNTVRGSNRSTKSGGKQQQRRLSQHSVAGGGIQNQGFSATNSEHDAYSNGSRYSSSQSLSTYKEQYCCSPNCRYTPRERKLCASVAVLATIIVILVIVVGYLAGKKNADTTFHWTF